MGRLIVVEGLDGAGKRTFTDALTKACIDRGAEVARFAFPRYGADVHADLVRDALYGRLGDLTDSVHGMSVLYALDRRAAIPELEAATRSHDVVLVDRFTASSAAYGAARLHQDADGPFAAWVAVFENERLGVPVPDHQVLLDVPPAVARGRAERREQEEPGRARDAYEADGRLQERVGEVYRGLAAVSWQCPWTLVDGSDTPDVAALVDRLGA